MPGGEVATEEETLADQLGELLGAVVDVEDALEVCSVAGQLDRMGSVVGELTEARAWLQGDGRELVEDLWTAVEVEPLLEAVDGCVGGNVSDEEVEEALLDFDDLVAAAAFGGGLGVVRGAAAEVASTVRSCPECFASMADEGKRMAKLKAVGMDPFLYDYWFAVADAAAAEG